MFFRIGNRLKRRHAIAQNVIPAWQISLTLAASIFANVAVAAPGDLFVSQPSNKVDDGSIIAFNSLGQRSIFASGLGAFVGDIAFDRTGTLFEVDHRSDTIVDTIFKIDPTGSTTKFASAQYLDGIAFDMTGNLFAAKYDGNGGESVIRFSPDGNWTTWITGLTGRAQLAFDRDNNLFVSEIFPANRILKIAPDGTQTIFASGLDDPTGLAFDSSGNLFVADQSSGKILKFTTSGLQSTFGNVVQPIDAAFDAAGNLFVSDYNNGFVSNGGFIYKFKPDGTRTIFASGIEPTLIAFQPVPEPSNLALTAVGIVGLIALQRHRGLRMTRVAALADSP